MRRARANDTCASVAAAAGGGLSLFQLQLLNPGLTCGGGDGAAGHVPLVAGQLVCMGPAGK